MATLVASMPPTALSDATSQSSDDSSASITSSEDASSSVRLFVGNLVPAISNDALTALLSKFGTVGAVERNDERRFAHVAFSGEVQRCISSIHKTRWLGTELRVEKATEHFMARLRREWAAAGAPAPDADAERDVVLPSFSWRGKRTVFHDDDAPAPPAAARTVEPAVHVPPPKSAVAPSRAPRAADVTLELFGLAPSAGEDATHAARGGADVGAVQGDASRPPANVAAARAALVDNTAEMMAIGEDPSKIDVKSEHARAAAVMDLILGTLASNEDEKRPASIPKRKALYKQLIEAGNAGDDVPGPAKGAPPASVASVECSRRNGLYKKLLPSSS